MSRRLVLLGFMIVVLWNPVPAEILARPPIVLLHDEVYLPIRGAYTFFYPYSLAVWGGLVPWLFFLLWAWTATWPPTVRPHLFAARFFLRNVPGPEAWFLRGLGRRRGGELLLRLIAHERRQAFEDWDACRGRKNGVVRRARRLALLDAEVRRRRGASPWAALFILLHLLLRQRLDRPDLDETGLEPQILNAARMCRVRTEDLKTLLEVRQEALPQDAMHGHDLLERLEAKRRDLDRRRRQAELRRFQDTSPRRPPRRASEDAPKPLPTPEAKRLWLDMAFLAALRWRAPELALSALECLRSAPFLGDPEPSGVSRETAVATPFDHRLCASLLEEPSDLSREVGAALSRRSAVLLPEDETLRRARAAELRTAAGELTGSPE